MTVVILDVDGILVDTNYEHAIAWCRAFREQQAVLPIWRIHRHIVMGGDQLVGELAGEEMQRRLGERLRSRDRDDGEDCMRKTTPRADEASCARRRVCRPGPSQWWWPFPSG